MLLYCIYVGLLVVTRQTLTPGAAGGALCEYRVWVYTSDLRGAGTDANVSLEIVGENDALPPRRLDSSENGKLCAVVFNSFRPHPPLD
eukprot:scaffold24890_cov14-Prasinocladus_malaysianus.AAC.1